MNFECDESSYHLSIVTFNASNFFKFHLNNFKESISSYFDVCFHEHNEQFNFDETDYNYSSFNDFSIDHFVEDFEAVIVKVLMSVEIVCK